MMQYENDNEMLPVNHRARWTEEELRTLLREIKKNLDLNTIANNHKRTTGAIKYKLIRYAIDKSEKDQSLSLNDLIKMTKLSKDDLISGFEKLHYDYEFLIEDYESEDESDEEDNHDEEKKEVVIKYNDTLLNRILKAYGATTIIIQIIELLYYLILQFTY
jgi:hypothetical protein